MIRVLVVHDAVSFGMHAPVLFSTEPDIDVVSTLPFDDLLVARAAELSPAVIVVDSELMVSQVLPTASELQARIPRCSLLVLCDPTKRGMLPPRRRGGSVSFLPKDASPPVFADAVRRLSRGERIVHPRLHAASLNTERGLSTRELEVLGLAAEGESVNDIARRLYLSGGTVRNYLSAVIFKTGARNRLDAIRIVRRDGWLR
jgi:two-component system response regulator DesR